MITQDKQALELLFCACIDGGTSEDYRALARQAEKMADELDEGGIVKE